VCKSVDDRGQERSVLVWLCSGSGSDARLTGHRISSLQASSSSHIQISVAELPPPRGHIDTICPTSLALALPGTIARPQLSSTTTHQHSNLPPLPPYPAQLQGDSTHARAPPRTANKDTATQLETIRRRIRHILNFCLPNPNPTPRTVILEPNTQAEKGY